MENELILNPQKFCYLNGDFITEPEARLSFKDLSFLRGYGVFEFLRLHKGKPLFLKDHLDRLYRSAKGMRLVVNKTTDWFTEIVYHLLDLNQPETGATGMRIGLTGGTASDGYSISTPSIIISQHQIQPPSAEIINAGIKLITHPHQRNLPAYKTIDYSMGIWLQPMIKEAGADDVLYHSNGMITECPRNNVFLIMDDSKLVTPATNVLEGITRKKIIEMTDIRMVEIRDVHLEELRLATEVFVTSTSKQILPVRQVDAIIYKSNTQSLRLLEKFRETYL